MEITEHAPLVVQAHIKRKQVKRHANHAMPRVTIINRVRDRHRVYYVITVSPVQPPVLNAKWVISSKVVSFNARNVLLVNIKIHLASLRVSCAISTRQFQ